MLLGCVVERQVDDQPQPAQLRLMAELDEVAERA